MTAGENSSLETGNRTLLLAASALSALDTVGTLASGFTKDKTLQEALHVLQAIEAIVNVVRQGFDGVITKEQVDRHLQERAERLAAGDRAARDVIDARFPK